jgi:predicted metal-dependent peptidase
VGVVPGRVRRPGKARVLAVIDTSASISTADLAEISAELKRMSRSHEVVVAECDAEIQACYPYGGPICQVHGRGNTDLRPPLQPSFLNTVRPDVIVYFTDGHGPAPERPPRPPVIWCLIEGGKIPATWGRVVRMGSAV